MHGQQYIKIRKNKPRMPVRLVPGQSKSRPLLRKRPFPVRFGRLGLLRRSVTLSSPTAMACLWAASVGGCSFCLPRLVNLFGRGMVIEGAA